MKTTRYRRLGACLAVLVLLAGMAGPGHTAGAGGHDNDPAALLALVNSYRVDQGLSPLTADSRLDMAAQRHAEAMAAQGFFSHRTPAGQGLRERLAAAGYAFLLAAENLAHGQADAAAAFAAWRDSPGHDRNMRLAAARRAGVGLVRQLKRTGDGINPPIWVFIFATPQQ